jgi:glycosyltransferase involved in cell wall biosynthesis
MNKICCIISFGSHYREPIYKLMDKKLGCDWFIGNAARENVKPLNSKLLHGYQKELKCIKFGKLWWYKSALKPLFDKQYTDFIFAFDVYTITYWLFLLIAKMKGKRVYTWGHEWYGRENWIKKQIKKVVHKLAYHQFVYGNYAKKIMIENGLNANKISVIYNSLDYDTQLKIRQNLQPSDVYIKHFQNDYPVIIFIGRLTKRKQLNMIIESQQILDRQNRKINLVFVGNGEEQENLQLLVDEYILNARVWFYGASYNEEENAKLLFNADLCVSPGDIGLTAIHCLMFGLPVISHKCFQTQGPEFESICEGKTGMFFEKDNIVDLVEKINAMLNLLQTNRDDIRQNCYEEIDTKWNPYYQINVFKQVFNSTNKCGNN